MRKPIVTVISYVLAQLNIVCKFIRYQSFIYKIEVRLGVAVC